MNTNWRAKVYDAGSGAFLGALTTRGARNLRDAERQVTARAALFFRMDPRAVTVRHLNQVSTEHTPAQQEVKL